jgi:hypothetical protein
MKTNERIGGRNDNDKMKENAKLAGKEKRRKISEQSLANPVMKSHPHLLKTESL